MTLDEVAAAARDGARALQPHHRLVRAVAAGRTLDVKCRWHSGTFAGLAPARTVLDNGAVVLAKQTQTTPAVTINLAVRAGSICDPPDAPGTT